MERGIQLGGLRSWFRMRKTTCRSWHLGQVYSTSASSGMNSGVSLTIATSVGSGHPQTHSLTFDSRVGVLAFLLACYKAAMQILPILLTLAPMLDSHGYPIVAPPAALAIIARVAEETPAPELFASWLYVLGAYESGYRLSAVGDGGQSCGAWQTPCARTRGLDGLGQARVAVAILKQAIASCPDHPLWAYASGRCVRTSVAVRYEAKVKEVIHHFQDPSAVDRTVEPADRSASLVSIP
jgi:hypothetical protein